MKHRISRRYFLKDRVIAIGTAVAVDINGIFAALVKKLKVFITW